MEKWQGHENFGEISVVDKVDGIMIRQGKGIKWLLFWNFRALFGLARDHGARFGRSKIKLLPTRKISQKMMNQMR
jgi:hypothetical protein